MRRVRDLNGGTHGSHPTFGFRFYLNNELPYLHAAGQLLKSGERTALGFQEASI